MMQYSPDDYDQYLTLKPSLGMVCALAYSARHMLLVVLAYLPLLPGKSDMAFLKSVLSPAMVLSDVPGLLLLLAWRNRRPEASAFWRRIWRQGRAWLLFALVAQLGLLYTTSLPGRLSDFTGAGLPAVAYLALHLIIIVYVASSGRLREVFRDFPALSMPPIASPSRVDGGEPPLAPAMIAARRVSEWDKSGLAGRLLDQVQAGASADPEVWGQLGRLAMDRDRLEEAADLFQRATDIDPHNPVHLQKLSEINRRLGRTHEALGAGSGIR